MSPYSMNNLLSQGDVVVDLSLIESFCGNDNEAAATIIKLFLTNMPTAIADLQIAHAEQAWKKLAQTAHSIKSSLSVIQIQYLYRIINEIEVNAKHETNTAAIPELVQQAIGHYTIIETLLQTELNKLTA